MSKGIYPNRAQLSEKGKAIAAKLSHVNFLASPGWLDQWKKRYSIKGKFAKSKACKGGKNSKKWVTVALIVNAVGEKEKVIVIGKSEKPRCFRLVKEELPVAYFSQKKVWMTRDIPAPKR